MIYLILTPWIIFFVWFIIRIAKDSIMFKYDPQNPFRRWCKKCGQQQNQYHLSYNKRITWWEEVYPMGNIKDCKCKNHIKE